ncbi:MAG: tetratricopeptide repeat protein [Thermoleophilia bacterium]
MTWEHVERGRFHLRRGDGTRALAEARQALAAEPDDIDAIELEADALSRLGRHDEAVAAARRMVAAEPDGEWSHITLSAALRAAGRFDEALLSADAALALAPDDPAAWLEKAGGSYGCDRFADVVEAADRGLAADPELDELLLLRGFGLLAMHRRREAEEAFRAVLGRNPDDARAHAGLARADFVGLRFGRAAEGVSSSLRIDPESADARRLLLETARARTPAGRIYYPWVLWISRFPTWVRWALIIGLYGLFRLLISDTGRSVVPMPVLVPLVLAYITFCLVTWFGPKLVDGYLRTDPERARLLDEAGDD